MTTARLGLTVGRLGLAAANMGLNVARLGTGGMRTFGMSVASLDSSSWGRTV